MGSGTCGKGACPHRDRHPCQHHARLTAKAASAPHRTGAKKRLENVFSSRFGTACRLQERKKRKRQP
ncbi:hypothetical protein L559_1208 [Bordetella pertussis STO1-CHOC-0017]|nr:hypothetical protein L559_1208 [Bordetella pertussis STO1-CHOC-0017]